MKKTIIVALLSFFFIQVQAQVKYLKDEAATQDLSKKVTQLFLENKISTSFSELILYWPLPKNEVDALEEKTIKYLNLIEERFGKPIGLLKISNEKIADIAIRETYLIRYENTAIRLKFTYYKNNNGWILNAFKWDDSFTEEFK
ncbi:hypothetical protein C3K47_12300 [Solitalea longa]|uniref:DUF4878 domain-containing protein n=1 Tax=Solitalea longa TaxID=2079460 RepID=A0A2S5A059_9SPHI|nr:hypothetical protein [Solitalea longa]POY35980.1 hypothetical protein C3K47_12300 [Solitalea longa]